MTPLHVLEGLRMFKHSLKKRVSGIPRYSGNSEQICQKILKRCWNEKYYQTSAGHFCEFYTRDFSWCTKPLMALGQKEKVQVTLEYAMQTFSRNKKVTVAINPSGKPFDYPNYAVDSLPYLLRSLVLSDSFYLIDRYHGFLSKEVERFMAIVIDKKTGLVKKSQFSSAKDHTNRVSSCYDNCMAGMLSLLLEQSGLNNPLVKYDYAEITVKNFWKGSYFVDDLSSKQQITGDANIFPFWSGAVKEKQMRRQSIDTIRKLKLDRPFPLKYSNKTATEIMAPNYQGNTIWSYLGMLYIDEVSKLDERLALYYLVKYDEVIKRNANFLELYEPDGQPYKTAFYVTDDSMIWASMYLELARRMGD